MGEQLSFQPIERSEVEEKTRHLKVLLGPSANIVFKLAEPIIEYREGEYKSSQDKEDSDRRLVEIFFENGTAAIIDIDTQSQPNKLVKAFKETDDGISVISPLPGSSTLHKIELQPPKPSDRELKGYLRQELNLGNPVKPVKRYIAPPAR